MINEWFAVMNEWLDEWLDDYPQASGLQKHELEDKLTVLKALSDQCMEHWLQFEEKLGVAHQCQQSIAPHAVQAGEEEIERSQRFAKGQGYFRLQMYQEAREIFKQMAMRQPGHFPSRIYLGVSCLELGLYEESCAHFHHLLEHYEQVPETVNP